VVSVAVISDTHMPRGARTLPAACVERLRGADLIVHAGDLFTLDVLRELRGYGEVAAVHGNVDDAAVRAALPERLDLTLEAARVVVVHNAGPAVGRIERMRRSYPEADAVIFGHSHMPLHETAADGFQIFNPGSPTEKRRSPVHTMGMAWAQDGHVEFELIELA
jgi:putative phosphoesterase